MPRGVEAEEAVQLLQSSLHAQIDMEGAKHLPFTVRELKTCMWCIFGYQPKPQRGEQRYTAKDLAKCAEVASFMGDMCAVFAHWQIAAKLLEIESLLFEKSVLLLLQADRQPSVLRECSTESGIYAVFSGGNA